MSASYDRLVDAAVESLRVHVLPDITNDFSRGQLFSVIFALRSLKLAGTWRPAPLLEQIAIQDAAFAAVKQLAGRTGFPALPDGPRAASAAISTTDLESLRNSGDRLIGGILAWTSGAGAAEPNATEIERILRGAVRDQLKVELALTPKSMLHAIATGTEV